MNTVWIYNGQHLLLYVVILIFFVLQVNRIKIPKQLDELVEMESESGNPVSKFFFRIKAEIHGVNIWIYIIIDVIVYWFLSTFFYSTDSITFIFYIIRTFMVCWSEICLCSLLDLSESHEVFQLPYEGKHDAASHSLVHALIWVSFFLVFFFFLCVWTDNVQRT